MRGLTFLVIWLAACSGPGSDLEAYRHRVAEAARLLTSGSLEQARCRLEALVRERPGEPLGHYALASLRLVAGRLDSAAIDFQLAVERDSLLAEARGGLGLIHTYRGEYAAASAEFERAIDLDAGHPAFHYDAGVVYEHRGMLPEARSAFEASLDIDPWNADAHQHLGQILLLLNEPGKALEHYSVAIRLARDRFEPWYGAGRAQAALGQDTLALASLQRARRLEDRAEVFYQLGLVYRKLGDLPAARAAFERFGALRPAKPDRLERKELKITDPDAARGQLDLGRLYARRGRPAEAAARYARAARMGCAEATGLVAARDDPAAVERRAGLEAMRRDRYAQAAGYYRMASRLDPRSAVSFRNLGLALASMQRNKAAAAAYERALALDPRLAPAYNDLALVLSLGREEHGRALELLHEAVDLAPGEKIFLYNLGHTYFTLTRLEEAATAFERVLQLDSTSALTHLFLGMVLGRSGRLAEAEGHLRKALEINSEYADAYFELGKIYSAEGQPGDARTMLERCIQLVPDHKYAHYALGQVYRDLGMDTDAEQTLARFRALRPHRKQHQYVFFAEPDTV